MDAVTAMEGDGPSHGSPRRVGWLLAGDNALAVDWAAAYIMCYADPLKIPLLFAAAQRGVGPRERSEITLEGALWSDLPSYGFKKSSGAIRMMPTFLRGFAHSLVSLTPRLQAAQCVRCGICRKVCPVDAIFDDASSYPAINRGSCVKCLCCHEMCPTGAMTVRKNFLASLAGRLRGD
jgi:ferredoxin